MSSDHSPVSDSSSPNPRTPSREQHVTSTGWRIVGNKAVSLVAEASANAGVPSGRDEDVLYAAKFQMRARMGTGSAVHAALATLGAALAGEWQDAPPLTRDRPVNRPPARFHGVRWETAGDADAWMGELVWRHPHPVVAGAPCTTHAILIEQHGRASLTLRVTADGGIASVRGTVGAGQAKPAFLAELNRALRLTFDGGDCEPRRLGDADIDAFVRDVLLSDSRAHPVAVLAPLELGGYEVPPAVVAEELLGLAHLYIIDRHPATYRLSDALGDRRLSCYWGALRVYMPEFSCADRPEEHPLLVRDRVVDPVMRADVIGKLGRFARARVEMPPGIAERRAATEAASLRESAAMPPAPAVSAAPVNSAIAERVPNVPSVPLVVEGVPAPATPAIAPADVLLTPILHSLGARIGELAGTIAILVDANTALAGEIARLRTTNAVRSVNTTSLERRIGSLEQLLVRALWPGSSVSAQPEPERREHESLAETRAEDDAESLSLVDVLRQAVTSHADALLVLDAAERSAAASPYMDVDRLAVTLDAMASVARRRQEGALGTSLRDAFRELGIDYRGGISAATSDKHRQQYIVAGSDGRVFECREHIVLGTSYDPRHCLRVYFTSRAPVEPRFVIGHVGKHFDVVSTS